MAVNKKNRCELITEFSNFGTILSYTLEQKTEEEKNSLLLKIATMLKEDSFENAKWYLNDILSDFGYQEENCALNYYRQRFTKDICFFELLPGYGLKEFTIDEESYLKTMNIHYTREVLKQVEALDPSQMKPRLAPYSTILDDIEQEIQSTVILQNMKVETERKVAL